MLRAAIAFMMPLLMPLMLMPPLRYAAMMPILFYAAAYAAAAAADFFHFLRCRSPFQIFLLDDVITPLFADRRQRLYAISFASQPCFGHYFRHFSRFRHYAAIFIFRFHYFFADSIFHFRFRAISPLFHTAAIDAIDAPELMPIFADIFADFLRCLIFFADFSLRHYFSFHC
jgi:hypothetical protein